MTYFPADYFQLLLSVFLPVILLILLWLFWKDLSEDKFCPDFLQKQSVEVEPGVRGSIFAKNGELITTYYEGVNTVYDAFQRGLLVSNDGPCYGHRDKNSRQYVWRSYSQVHDMSHRFGSALVVKGMKPQSTTNVGIYAVNSPEWSIISDACCMFSMVLVPLYDTLGPDVFTYIIDQTKMTVVVCENWTKTRHIIDKANSASSFKHVVIIKNDDFYNSVGDSNQTEDVSLKHGEGRQYISTYVMNAAAALNIEILSFDEMLQIGLRNRLDLVLPTPETVNVILYTSGTTGNPKGVVLTNKALISNLSGLIAFDFCKKLIPDHNSVHLSYLPAAHGFERLNQLMLIISGGRIGFSSGDIKLLLDDIAILRPTIFLTVPRVLNRVYDKVQTNLSKNCLKKILFNYGIKKKLELVQRGIITKNTIWDKLMFHKIQQLFGGRMETCISGSAPLSGNVMNFARATLGCFVYEGYGQTELGAAMTLTMPYEFQCGIIGPPLPSCHIKLIDIPEINCLAANNMGEICIRSPASMKEYYEQPTKTREVLDGEGFIHTGDVGTWAPNGSLKIIDRIKHVFKLSQGEYISPEKIENTYLLSPFVAQVFVDGNSEQRYPLAIVVPDEENVILWASKQPGMKASFKKLCSNGIVKKTIMDDMLTQGRKAGLKGFEQVEDIYIHTGKFTIEEGLITPTMKNKRPVLRKKFQENFEFMYKPVGP